MCADPVVSVVEGLKASASSFSLFMTLNGGSLDRTTGDMQVENADLDVVSLIKSCVTGFLRGVAATHQPDCPAHAVMEQLASIVEKVEYAQNPSTRHH